MIALLALIFFLPSLAPAAWSPVIACENFGMVVDREDTGTNFQLVIRNHPDTLSYFSSKADISHALNGKGEMVVQIASGGPLLADDGPRLYNGYISGQTNVVVSQIDASSVKVAIWQLPFRSIHNEEVANWVFRGCRFRPNL